MGTRPEGRVIFQTGKEIIFSASRENELEFNEMLDVKVGHFSYKEVQEYLARKAVPHVIVWDDDCGSIEIKTPTGEFSIHENQIQWPHERGVKSLPSWSGIELESYTEDEMDCVEVLFNKQNQK